MKEALDKRENDSDLLVIIIRSARRNDNIFGIHDPPYCDLLPISCRSRRSPILWLSTSGYGWPFAIRLLPSRGSALHQRHLWDCEHVPQKKQIFRFRSSIRLRQKQNNSVKEKECNPQKKCKRKRVPTTERRTTHKNPYSFDYSYLYTCRWTGDQARRCLLQIETLQVRSAERRLRRPRNRVVVLYQSLDEKTRVCRRSTQGTERSSKSWYLSLTMRNRVRSIG